MREIRSSGSVEGVVSNHDPYSDREIAVVALVSWCTKCNCLAQPSLVFDRPRNRIANEVHKLSSFVKSSRKSFMNEAYRTVLAGLAPAASKAVSRSDRVPNPTTIILSG